jgi:predicted transglutaminase-like cysteine proteinase
MSPRFIKQIGVLTCLMLIQLSVFSDITFTNKVFQSVEKRYGASASGRVREWQQTLIEHQNSPIDTQLFEINRFFNQIEFIDDIKHWGVNDYWATPLEFLSTNGGDCEDFTIAKYFSLRKLGVPAAKLRLMYVTATRPRQPHMVLAYYETPGAVPLVLDNMNKRILPASQRRDLIPVYSFNGDGLWLAKSQGRGRQMQSENNNALWHTLNKRMQQGF